MAMRMTVVYSVGTNPEKITEDITEDDIEIYEPIMYKSRLVIGKGKMQLFNDCFKFILENQK